MLSTFMINKPNQEIEIIQSQVFFKNIEHVPQDQSMNEVSLPGTRLMRMTPATHWRAEKSTAFPLASTLICVLPPGSGTSPFVLLPCPTPQMDAGQLLIPWNLNSHWDNKSLHKLLLELACERCTHSSVPFWGFFQNQFHHRQLSLDLVKGTLI